MDMLFLLALGNIFIAQDIIFLTKTVIIQYFQFCTNYAYKSNLIQKYYYPVTLLYVFANVHLTEFPIFALLCKLGGNLHLGI